MRVRARVRVRARARVHHVHEDELVVGVLARALLSEHRDPPRLVRGRG